MVQPLALYHHGSREPPFPVVNRGLFGRAAGSGTGVTGPCPTAAKSGANTENFEMKISNVARVGDIFAGMSVVQ